MSIVIHCEPRIEWQGAFADKMQRGLANIGLKAEIRNTQFRCSDIAILLGTTRWRNIENDGGRYLLVDRASFGDPYYVSLVWDGHGRRGDHKVPENPDPARWEQMELNNYAMVLPWRPGSKVILAGQTETYSPNYPSLDAWYGEVHEYCSHFRPHPAAMVMDRPFGLRKCADLDDCKLLVTLNSSIGVAAVMNGIPTVTMDEAAMAWDVTSHRPGEIITPERDDWLHWLAYTQWNHDEIEAGAPISHLFEDCHVAETCY
jgi:hypothetical protein